MSTGPICGTLHTLTQTRSHRPPFMPAHAIFSRLKHTSERRRLAAALFIRWRAPPPPPHGPRPSPLVVCTQTWSTYRFSTSPSIKPRFHVDADVQDLTHWEWAQMAPIAARQSQRRRESGPPIIHMYVPNVRCTRVSRVVAWGHRDNK